MNGIAYVFIGSSFSYISSTFDLQLIYTTIRRRKETHDVYSKL